MQIVQVINLVGTSNGSVLFMLNSIEYEISTGHKSKMLKKRIFLLCF